ncbi:hypothetical protein D9M71_98860 [compost metagenome]
MGLVALGPVGEQARGVFHEAGRPLQALVQLVRVERAGLGVATDAFDAQLCGFFAFAVEEGLAHDQRIALGLKAQPVGAGRFLAEDDLEAAVGVDFQVVGVNGARGGHGAVGFVAAFLGAEAQVGNAATLAADPVTVAAVEAGVLVEVVGVVGADLGGFMGR